MSAAASPAKRRRIEDDAGQAQPITLYSYWRSSSSYRVRIVLNLKKLGFEYNAVHLLKDGGQQLKDDYAALNPMKEVPTLLIDGNTLTQSQAIIEYLEETRSEPALLPQDPAERCLVRQLCCIISNDIQPVGNLRVLKHVASFFEDKPTQEAKKLEWLHRYMSAGFQALEALMIKCAGKYSFGDEVTMADVFLVPQIYNALRFNVDMSAYPTVSRVYEALKVLPEFAAAEPGAQPDAE